MEKEYYLININNSYYGKKQQYLPLDGGKDNYELALIVEEIGYKTKQGAFKGLKSLEKKYKKSDLIIKNASIEKTKIIRNN